MTKRRVFSLAFASILVLVSIAAPALAQRGHGGGGAHGGGGMRGGSFGGGGGMRGGSFGGGGMRGGSFGGGGGMRGGSFGGGGRMAMPSRGMGGAGFSGGRMAAPSRGSFAGAPSRMSTPSRGNAMGNFAGAGHNPNLGAPSRSIGSPAMGNAGRNGGNIAAGRNLNAGNRGGNLNGVGRGGQPYSAARPAARPGSGTAGLGNRQPMPTNRQQAPWNRNGVGRPGSGNNGPDNRPGAGGGNVAQRPGNRPPVTNRPGNGGRPGTPDNNRPGGGLNNGPGNRPGGIAGRPGGNVGNQRPGWNGGNGNWNGGRGGNGGNGSWNGGRGGNGGNRNWNGGHGNSWPGRGNYGWRHGGWQRGYWNGFYNGYALGSLNNWGWGGWGWGLGGWGLGGWGLGWGLGGWGWGGGWGLGGWGWPGYGFGSFGLGLGYGLSSWCYGSPYYYWGYEPYYNPYYSSAVIIQQPVYLGADTTTIYDYSQPLNTQAAPAVETDADQALDLFDQARDAFKAGQYQTALGLTDQALAKTPQDAALHEFRALTLFALGRFDDAAAVIYPVLAVGPGWNWATMIGLYPNVDVYTQQLRALEAFRVQHDNDPAPAFLLAYHYLTMGHKDNARAQLEAVVKLQPDDRIASQLLTQLTGKQPAVAPAAAPKLEDAGKQFAITGNWSATAGDGAETITLNIKDGGSFEWKVNQKGQARTLAGTSTLGSNGLLTLASNDAGVMVGQVRWSDPDHFNFRLVGAQGDDQGLNFTRAQ